MYSVSMTVLLMLVVSHVVLNSLAEVRHRWRRMRARWPGLSWRRRLCMVSACLGMWAVLASPAVYYGLHLVEAAHGIV